MSGVATDPWVLQWEAREAARRLGEMVECPKDSSSALVECLRTIDARKLVELTKNFRVSLFSVSSFSREWPASTARCEPSSVTDGFDSIQLWSILPFTFTPRVDFEVKNPFLPDDPKVLLREGRFAKVPFMTGLTREEGLFLVYRM